MSTATDKRTLLLAQLPTGTAANNVVELDGSAKLPAVDGSQLTGVSPAPLPINSQTGTSYTLQASDVNSIVSIANTSAQTVTIPPNSSAAIAIGKQVFIEQAGTGSATIAAGAGVTINAIGGALSIGTQYAVVSAVKVATDTWLLSGVPTNFAALPAIGGTTPNSGAFTVLSAISTASTYLNAQFSFDYSGSKRGRIWTDLAGTIHIDSADAAAFSFDIAGSGVGYIHGFTFNMQSAFGSIGVDSGGTRTAGFCRVALNGLGGSTGVGLTDGGADNTIGFKPDSGSPEKATMTATALTFVSGMTLVIPAITLNGVALPAISKDAGWTANSDAGSKSAIIPAAATLATIQTAMNLAVAGSGDALAATAAKVKAIENSLALTSPLLPNA